MTIQSNSYILVLYHEPVRARTRRNGLGMHPGRIPGNTVYVDWRGVTEPSNVEIRQYRVFTVEYGERYIVRRIIILRRRIYFPEFFFQIIGPKTGPRPYLSIKFIFRIYRIYLIFRNIFFRILGPKTGPGPYLSNIFIFRIYQIYSIFRIIYRIYLIVPHTEREPSSCRGKKRTY